MHKFVRFQLAVLALAPLMTWPSVSTVFADDLSNCKNAIDQTQNNNTGAAILYGFVCGIQLNGMLHQNQDQQQQEQQNDTPPADDTPRWPPNSADSGDKATMAYNHASWFTEKNIRDCLTTMRKGLTQKNNAQQDVAASQYLYCYEDTPEQQNPKITMHVIAAQSRPNFDGKNNPWWVNVVASELTQKYVDLQNTPIEEVTEGAAGTFTLSNGGGVMHVVIAFAFANGQQKPGGGKTSLILCAGNPSKCSGVTVEQLPKMDQDTVRYLAAADLDMIKIHMGMQGTKLDLSPGDQPDQKMSDGLDALTPANIGACFSDLVNSPKKRGDGNDMGTSGGLTCARLSDTTESTHFSSARAEAYADDVLAKDGTHGKGYVNMIAQRNLIGGGKNERDEELQIEFTTADGASVIRVDRRLAVVDNKAVADNTQFLQCKNGTAADCDDLKGQDDLDDAARTRYSAILANTKTLFGELKQPPIP